MLPTFPWKCLLLIQVVQSFLPCPLCLPSALNGKGLLTMSSPSDHAVNFTPSSGSQGDFGRLRLAYFSNEFPHDNLHLLLRRLWNHSKDRAHPLLAVFISEATLAIREEIRELPTELKSLIPAFQTIFDFADYPDLRRGQLSGSIDGVLLAAVEIAAFIGYVSLHTNCWNFPRQMQDKSF